MPRFYLRFTILFIPLFALLIATMSALGSTQPIHPALRGFMEGCEDIPQPCWYGVVPGVTLFQDAERILIDHGYVFSNQETLYRNPASEFCSVGIYKYWPEEAVGWMFLENCTYVPLGGILDILGLPQDVHVTCDRDRWLFGQGYFIGISSNEVTYNSSITDIILYYLSPPFDRSYFRSSWQGLASWWRYAELDSNFVPC